jgi:long-chain acyl-CoA synthetase
MINMLANHPRVKDYDLSSLKYILYGASPMPEGVLRKALDVLPGCAFIHAYGMTEAAPILTILPPRYTTLAGPYAGRIKSCGLAAHTVELKIVDANRREVPRGTSGEVAARGPMIMLGYWNKPEETAAVLENGWYYSGDAAYMDDEGFLFIVDRLKDMIISGGENVYSAEVENAISLLPGVTEVAVIGIPDAQWRNHPRDRRAAGRRRADRRGGQRPLPYADRRLQVPEFGRVPRHAAAPLGRWQGPQA